MFIGTGNVLQSLSYFAVFIYSFVVRCLIGSTDLVKIVILVTNITEEVNLTKTPHIALVTMLFSPVHPSSVKNNMACTMKQVNYKLTEFYDCDT